MNLVIRNIDPKTRGDLYRLQGEQELKNLGEALTYILDKYYESPHDDLSVQRDTDGLVKHGVAIHTEDNQN